MNVRLAVLDTATDILHLGVCDGEREWVRALPGGAAASAALLPALLGLLEEAGLQLSDLDAIGFGRGPGAFTGVRTACAVAQGLAFGSNKPVLALDTLMAVADDSRRQGAGTTVWAAVDARMGEAYAARYRHVDGRWHTVETPALHAPAALAALVAGELQPPPQAAAAAAAVESVAVMQSLVAVAGNSLDAHRAAWHATPVSRWPQAAPRAAALLALARAAWAAGETLDAAQALPLYVRDRVAQTSAERAASAAAAATTVAAVTAAPTATIVAPRA